MGSVSLYKAGETELSGSCFFFFWGFVDSKNSTHFCSEHIRTAVKFVNLPKLKPEFDFFIIRILI